MPIDDTGKETSAFLLRHVVELASGLALIVGGVVLTAIGSGEDGSAALQVLGGVMTALGGVMLSWVAAELVGQHDAERRVDAAQQEIFAHLDAVRRGLGQAAGEINRTVSQVQQGVLDGRIAFPLISQATSAIVGQVNEIGVMRGSVLDPADLVETYEVVAEIAERLDELGRTPRAPVADELAEAASLLRSLIQDPSKAQGVTRNLVDTEVQCPECESGNVVALGDVPGDTAASTCGSCGAAFSAHRRGSGTAFARAREAMAAAGRVSSEETVACPTCGFQNFVMLGTSSGSTAPVNCRRCSERFNLHRAADGSPFTRTSKIRRSVGCPECHSELTLWWPPTDVYCPACHAHLRQDGDHDRLAATAVMDPKPTTTFNIRDGRPTVDCAACGKTHRALFEDDANFIAVCFQGDVASMVNRAIVDEANSQTKADSAAIGPADATDA